MLLRQRQQPKRHDAGIRSGSAGRGHGNKLGCDKSIGGGRLDAHSALHQANPLSAAQLETLIAFIAEQSPATAIDIGCGPGAASIALCKRCAVSVLAVDINDLFLKRADESAQRESLVGSITFRKTDPKDLDDSNYDAVMCLGSSHAIGSPREALAWCRSRLNPQGLILFADLVWKASPSAQFTTFLGANEAYYWHEGDATQAFQEAGLRILKTESASTASWQAYEGGILQGRQIFAAQLPAEEATMVLSRALAWKDAFDEFGSKCLGFTAYIATAL